jgi:uncharacterized membrane protein (DUF373 family)
MLKIVAFSSVVVLHILTSYQEGYSHVTKHIIMMLSIPMLSSLLSRFQAHYFYQAYCTFKLSSLLSCYRTLHPAFKYIIMLSLILSCYQVYSHAELHTNAIIDTLTLSAY